MNDIDALCASFEAGDAPLDVVADWYEESGHELAAGVRWLANNEKSPGPFGMGWYWYRTGELSRQLPEPVFDTLVPAESFGAKRFPTIFDAVEGAAAAVVETWSALR